MKSNIKKRAATTTTTNLVVARTLIATVVLAALSIALTNSIPSLAFANSNSDQGKDLRCDKDDRGSGNPHDKENPQNPHDTQLGFYRGNPHDECAGS
jgi:hypothetical protein